MLLLLVCAAWPLVRGAIDQRSEDSSLTLVVPTYFGEDSSPRFQLTLKTLNEAVRAHIPIVVVDASGDTIRERLRETGAHVVKQTKPGKKGVALREGIELALSMRRSGASDHVIGFFEPEKLGMVFWMRKAAAHLRQGGLDIVIPGRQNDLFAASYPVEQYHQEKFANLFISSMATARGFPRGLDWTFGPVLFSARLAPIWLGYRGALWDAQVVPYVRAVLWHGAKLGGFEVPYSHPAQMKLEEEGKAQWAKKRYEQLSLWAAILPKELSATLDPTKTREGRIDS